MNKITNPRLSHALVLSLLASLPFSQGGCDQTPKVTTVDLLRLGEACMADSDCGSAMCKNGKCSRKCIKQADCPTGFDCGFAAAADAPMFLTTCYKSTWDTTATGGFGTNCAPASKNPASSANGAACDGTVANPCASGFSCRYSLKCDPNAYCTKTCTADTDCPPTFFCGQDIPSDGKCATDADCANRGDGFKCAALPGGTATFCTSPSRCLKREACSPAAVADQCPQGLVLGQESSGEKFCARSCLSDADCLQPGTNSQTNSPTGVAFEKCTAAGGNLTGNVCRPTVGACHGPSPVAKFAATPNSICSPCRIGEINDCTGGVCFMEEFTNERFCVTPCTVQIKMVSGGYAIVAGSDNCTTGATCNPVGFDPKDMTACPSFPCTVGGVCYAKNTDNSLTCYPNP